MIIEVLKSKIHRAKVTQAELNYVGSITIDEDLIEAANIIPNEKVQIVNNNKHNAPAYVPPLSSSDKGKINCWIQQSSPNN